VVGGACLGLLDPRFPNQIWAGVSEKRRFERAGMSHITTVIADTFEPGERTA
jgi:hypothetical protein